MPRAPSTYTSSSPKGILLHSKKLWMRVMLPYYLSPITIIMPPMVLIYERSSGSSPPPPPPPPVSLNPGINDLMTSNSSNHDFHLQTPLSTTTTTTTTPHFKTEKRAFAARNLRNVLMMDGWVGPQISLSLSLSLSLSSLARELQSYIYLFSYLIFL
jgi:hypothetical protein